MGLIPWSRLEFPERYFWFTPGILCFRLSKKILSTSSPLKLFGKLSASESPPVFCQSPCPVRAYVHFRKTPSKCPSYPGILPGSAELFIPRVLRKCLPLWAYVHFRKTPSKCPSSPGILPGSVELSRPRALQKGLPPLAFCQDQRASAGPLPGL